MTHLTPTVLAKQLIDLLTQANHEDLTPLALLLNKLYRRSPKKPLAASSLKPSKQGHQKTREDAACYIGLLSYDNIIDLTSTVPLSIYNPFTLDQEEQLQQIEWLMALHGAAAIALLFQQKALTILPPESLVEWTSIGWPCFADIEEILDLTDDNYKKAQPEAEVNAKYDPFATNDVRKPIQHKAPVLSLEQVTQAQRETLPTYLPKGATTPELLTRLNVAPLLHDLFSYKYTRYSSLKTNFPKIVEALFHLMSHWSTLPASDRPRIAPAPQFWLNKKYYGYPYRLWSIREVDATTPEIQLHRVMMAITIARPDLWTNWGGAYDPRYYAESRGMPTRGISQKHFMWAARYALGHNPYDWNPYTFKHTALDGLTNINPYPDSDRGEDVLLDTPRYDVELREWIK